MPTFIITIKVRTKDPPHESLGSTHEITSHTILDPYRKVYDLIGAMTKPHELEDVEPE